MIRTVSGGRYAATPDFLLSDTSAQSQFTPVFAALPGGGFVAVWNDYGFSGSSIRAQIFNGNGREVGAEFVVDSGGTEPAVAVLANGSFVVSWSEESADTDFFDIKARLYDAGGTPIGPEFIVNTTTPGLQSESVVTGLAGGGFVVTWMHAENTGFDHVRGQVFAANGAKVGGELIVTDAQPGDKGSPEVVALADGGFVAAWLEWNGAVVDQFGNTSPDSRAQIFDAAGNKVGAALTLNTVLPGYQQMASLVALPSGGFAAVWADNGNASMPDPHPENTGIWIQLFDATGAKAGNDRLVSDLGASTSPYSFAQVTPSVEIIHGVGLLVTWVDNNITADSDRAHLRGQLLDFAGNEIGEEFSINPDLDATQRQQDVIVLANGAIVVGWTNEPGPLYGDQDVQARIFFPIVYGTGGNDSFAGTANRDFFFGKAGDDLVSGGIEDDGLSGEAGNDTLNGDAGNDELDGGTGNDSLNGGAGNDQLDGGAGVDTLTGGEGDDIYFIDEAGDAVIEASNQGADEIRTDLGTYSLVGIANLENLTGTSLAGQDLRGNSSTNLIRGGDGGDFIRLQDGGDDIVTSGAGNDAIYFGAAFTSADSADGGDGKDIVALQGNYNLTLGGDDLIAVETLSLLPSNDARFGGNAAGLFSYSITTNAVDLPGGMLTVNAATLQAGENFTFNGSAERFGGFFIYGGKGVDILTGSGTVDIFFFGEDRFAAGDRVNGDDGNDILVLRGDYEGANAIIFAADAFFNIETISLLSALDTRFAAGGAEYDYDLTFVDANVSAGQTLTINGARGETETIKIDGSAETDGSFRMFTGFAPDVLKGGAGNDLFYGGRGADTISGGTGNDTFRYDHFRESTPDERDSILDFNAGDIIDLSRINAVASPTGANEAYTFIGSDAFSGFEGQLRAENVSGANWIIQGDRDGDMIADFELSVIVADADPITAGDFFL